MKPLFFVFWFSAVLVANVKPVTWTMVNVNDGFLQGDAHLLEMPDGKTLLIDACGNNEALLGFLKKKKIQHIDQVLISHMHKDHYGGLLQLISAGIRVDEIRMTLPSEKTCKAEAPWGCDWSDVQAFKKTLIRLKIPIKGYRNAELLYNVGETRLQVIAAYPSHKTPVGEVDVNDTSAILSLTNGRTRALFTGDLNRRLGEWLANHSHDLHADILKVPHHGAEATAPDSFFDKVGAKFALVPSPAGLWFSERSARLRRYFSKKGTLVYVNALSGDVRVTMSPNSMTIDPERESPTKAIHHQKSLSE